MAEDVQPLTLQQRIAALNASHVNQLPGNPPPSRPKPHFPNSRPAALPRQKTVSIPPESTRSSAENATIGNLANGSATQVLPPPPIVRLGVETSRSKPPPPPLPKRESSQPCPALPPRRPAEQNPRRISGESTSSLHAGVSGTSPSLASRKSRESLENRVRAPAWGESELPPLPSRRNEAHKLKPGLAEDPETPPASLPPRLPARRQTDHTTDSPNQTHQSSNVPSPPARGALDQVKRLPPAFVAGNPQAHSSFPAGQPSNGGRYTEPVDAPSQPPAVPLASRPKLSAAQLTTPTVASTMTSVTSAASTGSSGCMICRDFSGPDHHASLFPRQSVRSLQTLGCQLTSPFPSATDKARAIFTWLHHNVVYDTESFFARNVQPSTPQSTLQTGLAVCEGYAALFTTLATHAGLESVVISGHGKGYGYTPLPPGTPIPSYSSNHAWNAVRIDGGEWKLIDSCWGAGHVQGQGKPFIKHLEPQHFTMTNEEFGIKHFPTNRDMFFLPNGRRLGWEEYIQINPKYWPSVGSNPVEPPTVFSGARPEYGIGERTVCPRSRFIHPRAAGTLRFSFELRCPHWTLQTHTQKGPPPVFILAMHGIDGQGKDYMPLEHLPGRGRRGGGGSINSDRDDGGDKWQTDIDDPRRLGNPGQTVTLFAITSFGDRSDARGLTVQEFRQGKGKVGMRFSGVAAWELA